MYTATLEHRVYMYAATLKQDLHVYSHTETGSVCVGVCVWVCVCVRACVHTRMRVCMCVCVCVFVGGGVRISESIGVVYLFKESVGFDCALGSVYTRVDHTCLFCELQVHVRGKHFTNTPLHYSRKSKDNYIIIIIIIL